ncbi:exonuclease [Mucilaginibacter terrenus]|uniref:Exonuclease n=1 Tax=Mucilaginibacter terrenus TaxID=2482727 RepID=A0A3E2NX70_9SPHI|nr:MBL fold metallo-hydrolase [Mucilaginibacter terrenus]RFZ85567.1 exonuclease [Mucilaginibacter terrenus]
MILEDFLQFDGNGLYCRYGDFYLDPLQPVANAVISHAHADHAVSGNTNVYATAATIAFMQLRYGKNAGKQLITQPYSKVFDVRGVEVSFIPAGHIPGSAQVLMEYQGTRYLYTGDYKLQPDNTCEPMEFVQADVLITETTFADQNTTHPDPVEEIKKLNDIKVNVLLGAYGLGKSQRLIRMINDYAPQKKVLVHHKVMPINNVYKSLGYNLGAHQLYNRKLMKTQEEWVYIVPPFTFDSYIRATGVKRLFASGWKNLQVNTQDTLFISDHVDWNDIITTINNVQPKQIWTLHGDGRQLKEHFVDSIFVKILN